MIKYSRFWLRIDCRCFFKSGPAEHFDWCKEVSPLFPCTKSWLHRDKEGHTSLIQEILNKIMTFQIVDKRNTNGRCNQKEGMSTRATSKNQWSKVDGFN